MNSFSYRVQHVALNSDCSGYESTDVYSYYHKLHTINPRIFPPLPKDFFGDGSDPKSSAESLVKGELVQGKINQKFHVRPHEGVLEKGRCTVDTKPLDEDIASAVAFSHEDEDSNGQNVLERLHKDLNQVGTYAIFTVAHIFFYH